MDSHLQFMQHAAAKYSVFEKKHAVFIFRVTKLVQLNIHVEFNNIVLLQKSVFNMKIKLYNKVPESIINWINLNSLKRN